MLVLLNPEADAGRAMEKWARVARSVKAVAPPCEVVRPADLFEARAAVAFGLRRGERTFVAAGGDGTVNLLIRLLTELAPRPVLADVTVGAVGLGSSNDFHKPLAPGATIDGVPCRLDFGRAARVDVCRLTYRLADGGVESRPWVVNASIGATAEGNLYFNRGGGRWFRRLRDVSVDAALALAAMRAVCANRPRVFALSWDGHARRHLPLRNLGVVKNPHFTGALRYDSPFEPGNGRFDVHVLAAVSRWRMWARLLGLARGRFVGRPGALSWRATRLSVAASDPFAVEADGEVVVTTAARFSVEPRLLRVAA